MPSSSFRLVSAESQPMAQTSTLEAHMGPAPTSSDTRPTPRDSSSHISHSSYQSLKQASIRFHGGIKKPHGATDSGRNLSKTRLDSLCDMRQCQRLVFS
eukprot:6456502-Amphidinium_carterae.3